jgi:hypothetical protein
MTSPEHADETDTRPASFLQMFIDAETRDDTEPTS